MRSEAGRAGPARSRGIAAAIGALALTLAGCLGSPDGAGVDVVAPDTLDAADTADVEEVELPEPVEVPPTGTCPAGVVGGKLGRTRLLIGGDVSEYVFTELPVDMRAMSFNGPIPDGDRTIIDFLNHTAGGGAVPLVTYRGWEALAGAPPGLAEIQALQRGDLVSAYLADYRRFCRDVGELVGFRAIIHLEPDLAGHAQRAADDPASVPVALAAAGATECAGLGDDFGGLGRCLVRIARAEAPYALIAVHASSWANGPDAFFEVDPQYDPFPSAGRVGAFLAAAGGDEADLVALEMSDRDAAYDGRWWDDRDLAEPNFARAILWAKQVGRVLDAPILWWRVPFGNMLLEDTCGRYRDNRLDYVFDHVDELVEANVLGVSFGAGADCMTTGDTDDDHFLRRERDYVQSGGALLCGGK